ncbi:MAG: hypothetical protein L6R41_001546 [Letrouitia leprolyta]|nr:MAG: hypothetical protein L6R41_001546 [Letrouitia leprolyta]
MAPSIPQTRSPPQHTERNPSGLVEALDREAARMHAAHHLVRAREELVQSMHANGIIKQVPPVQGEENVDSDQSLQAQVQPQPQPRPRPRIPAQVQAQWRGQESQGLGISMGGDAAAGRNYHESSMGVDEGRLRQEREEAQQQRRVQVQQYYQKQHQGIRTEGCGKQVWERRDGDDDGAYGSERGG